MKAADPESPQVAPAKPVMSTPCPAIASATLASSPGLLLRSTMNAFTRAPPWQDTNPDGDLGDRRGRAGGPPILRPAVSPASRRCRSHVALLPHAIGLGEP